MNANSKLMAKKSLLKSKLKDKNLLEDSLLIGNETRNN